MKFIINDIQRIVHKGAKTYPLSTIHGHWESTNLNDLIERLFDSVDLEDKARFLENWFIAESELQYTQLEDSDGMPVSEEDIHYDEEGIAYWDEDVEIKEVTYFFEIYVEGKLYRQEIDSFLNWL